MQYLFYIAYQRSDLLSSDELEVILDKLMALINGIFFTKNKVAWIFVSNVVSLEIPFNVANAQDIVSL
jgi:hypothetical protein